MRSALTLRIYAMETTSPLSAAVRAAVEPELPALAEEIVEAIRREVPEYARPMRGTFGRNITAGVREALARFGTTGEGLGSEVYRALGRGELREGRSLDALQSAYRIGARVAWRRLSRAAAAAGVPVAEQHALAEAIFAYIDQLASESVEGYAAAQADLAGDLQRRRETLLALLLAPVPAGEAVVAAAAGDAAWTLPRRVAVLVVGPSDGHRRSASRPSDRGVDPGRLARRLSGDVLHGRSGILAVAVVPDPAPLVAETTAAVERLGARVGIGPTVELAQAPHSLDWATRALALDGAVVVAEERLGDLLIDALPDVRQALRARVLAPLSDETPRSRDRLAETLRAWLGHAGARAAVAAELGVHPQTVRYRVARLRELFGERLDDPEARFELMLALR
ncbi:MAG: PucR family transcriptional regulator [Solirubrobacterales bacterium]|nr:PucR family transcriptional regulator [Solirubrobacterales bacterium]